MTKGDLIKRSELLKEFNPNGDRLDRIFVRSRIVLAKGVSEQEIRNTAIEEFVKEIRDWQIDIQDNERDADKFDFVFERIYEIAGEMRGAK